MRHMAMALLAALAAVLSIGVARPAAPKVGKLRPDAAILFLSGMAGEKDPFGFPAQEIYAAGIDGGHITRLTWSRWTHNHLAASPDRRYIATNRYVKGDVTGDGRLAADDFKQMWVIDLKAGKEWPVAPDMDGGIGGIAWSPDGKWIHFASWSDQARHKLYDDSMDIYRGTVDGGTIQKLTGNLSKLMGETNPRKFTSDVAVSHDGKWMAIDYKPASLLSPTASKAHIGLVSVDGKRARVLSDGGPEPAQMRGRFGIGDTDPDFSPDDKFVATTRSTTRNYVFKGITHDSGLSSSDMIVIKVATGEARDVSPPGYMDTTGVASWGDDCKLLYTHWTDRPHQHRDAQYMNPDGSALTTIPGLPEDLNKVQWLPHVGSGRCDPAF